ncbi:hypothetical protein AZE42_04949 [Rhizopogon vesiculosus]|uniref:Uncharacterized protein n=1 Tax=Rhizopogon vesiculosus TaxID=180088 RepID=A0A1J8PXW2_9AGAM|nr:hypothetical protein AZE42_04949 [Rhizopogon vesiculosus]
MLGLANIDAVFRLKPTLPLDGCNFIYSKFVSFLLSPLKLAKLANITVLRPILFILFRLCSFIMLLRPIFDITLNKLGQASRWTLFCYSPQNLIVLLKLLTLALTAAVMYNPGAITKSLAFIYAVSMVAMRLTMRLLMRAGWLMFKFITLLVRFVFRLLDNIINVQQPRIHEFH